MIGLDHGVSAWGGAPMSSDGWPQAERRESDATRRIERIFIGRLGGAGGVPVRRALIFQPMERRVSEFATRWRKKFGRCVSAHAALELRECQAKMRGIAPRPKL